MLCLIGFELYSRWVPRMLRAFLDKIEAKGLFSQVIRYSTQALMIIF